MDVYHVFRNTYFAENVSDLFILFTIGVRREEQAAPLLHSCGSIPLACFFGPPHHVLA